ncbi:hypothetical protein CORC01_07938 [Colletotrichum orchidophilum]|uniref:Uncharacterized protein n=1 Tax=Colletotrichum orchidophilum TaxID=1209926 RepID=A0A1G4B670_9PEZI|nr:uncharacterized protein CORC01_07938 [Colletotrichum orchidophilum]OHE96792.1 hypothetical protein CORC01_07938 [Colletotrichum orchidophilum]
MAFVAYKSLGDKEMMKEVVDVLREFGGGVAAWRSCCCPCFGVGRRRIP